MKFFGMDMGQVQGVPPGKVFEHLLQVLAVSAYVSVQYHYTSLIGVLMFFGCLFSPFVLFALGYVWWYYRTRESPYKGGFKKRNLRNLRMWQYFRAFFPMHMHKTAEIDPNKNYIFALHPRGVIGASKMAFMGAGSTDFHFKFPGLTPHILTEPSRFRFPLTREILLFSGVSADDRRNMDYILHNRGHCQKLGQVVVLALGEEDEALRHTPNKMVLAIRSRKDFIRMALKSGASLVPVLSFGESGIVNVRPSEPRSQLRQCQEFVRSVLKVPFPLISGRDMALHAGGFLPIKTSINVVVGKPIEVQRVEHPTEEQTNQLFDAYCKELEALFSEQKAKYFENPNIELSIE